MILELQTKMCQCGERIQCRNVYCHTYISFNQDVCIYTHHVVASALIVTQSGLCAPVSSCCLSLLSLNTLWAHTCEFSICARETQGVMVVPFQDTDEVQLLRHAHMHMCCLSQTVRTEKMRLQSNLYRANDT